MTKRRDPEARFWEKVDRSGDCWLWTKTTNHDGYGRFWVDRVGYLAHRFSYQLRHGEIPKGLVLDHLCRVRTCVRPEHLEPKTDRDNILAPGSLALAKINSETPECPRGHALTEPNLIPTQLKKGSRECLACNRARSYCRRHPEVELLSLSHQYYSKIMRAAAA
ncbi:HNH endonuclease signature motif containing protein [Amycolatopsis kentuckyensis]|uniref:HNH endonuclease signature motif containing protein n=1 Tax=Amycolatopsis kentuckyensis TaxID=218823 RepID=UPI000A364D06